jgi:CheY-like chemotaxis protein
VARVLIADADPTSRLTLQTVLRAGGYCVDTAASAAEAVHLLDSSEYQLVLTDLEMETPDSGLKVIQHARIKPYQPAAALVTSSAVAHRPSLKGELYIAPEDIPELLEKVAALIGKRATRRLARSLR